MSFIRIFGPRFESVQLCKVDSDPDLHKVDKDPDENKFFCIKKFFYPAVLCAAPDVDDSTKEWAFKLLEANMKPLYDRCYEV